MQDKTTSFLSHTLDNDTPLHQSESVQIPNCLRLVQFIQNSFLESDKHYLMMSNLYWTSTII